MSDCGKNYYFLGEHSSSDYADSISDYLPDDETFVAKNIKNTNTRKMLEVFGKRLKKYSELTNLFTNEMSPSCADQLINEWESMLSIPDDCFNTQGDLSERQRNATIKAGGMGVQTTEEFQKLAESFEITAVVQSGIDYANATGYVFAGGDREARFTIVITFNDPDTTVFPYTFTFQFSRDILGLLECVFKKVRPANCNVLFFTIV